MRPFHRTGRNNENNNFQLLLLASLIKQTSQSTQSGVQWGKKKTWLRVTHFKTSILISFIEHGLWQTDVVIHGWYHQCHAWVGSWVLPWTPADVIKHDMRKWQWLQVICCSLSAVSQVLKENWIATLTFLQIYRLLSSGKKSNSLCPEKEEAFFETACSGTTSWRQTLHSVAWSDQEYCFSPWMRC